MFKPDQPISSYEEDILGRASFAQSLADAILSYKEKDSIVIGLFGAWGSGKTSISNMALEHIDSVSEKKTDDEKPIIIRFNPWNFSDQNQLITQFFKQLSVVLNRSDYGADAKKAGERLELYAKFFEPLTIVPQVGPIALIISKVFKNVGSGAKSWGDLKSNDLSAIKAELNGLLEKQSHKIIIVIDDIDRLNDTEIRQIFQLIKSLGDFPNTIYLLAFDKNVVINALEKVQEGYGAGYLEKVVQIPFEVPLISKQEVEHLLFSQLVKLVKDMHKTKWDRNYLENTCPSGFKCFFRNIRDVTRYINSLRFSFELVKDDVNPIDFFAITAIQVFAPAVYYGIRDNKDIFSGVSDSSYGDNASNEQAKKRCDEIIGRVTEPSPEVLKDFLKRLFPKLESIYGDGYSSSDRRGNWRKDCRICSPDIFDIYFRLALPKGEISQKEIRAILSLGNNPDAFDKALLKLNEDERISSFLYCLPDYTQDIPEKDVKHIVTVLMDMGDLFSETDTQRMSLYLLDDMVRRFDSREKRFDILKHAMKNATKSLHTVVREVYVQRSQHGKDGHEHPKPEEKRTVSSEQLKELEKLACDKIKNWSRDGRLAKSGYSQSILYLWKEWEQEDEVNVFVKNMIRDDGGLIDFITIFLSESVSAETSYWHINLKSVEEFVDLKEIELRLKKIHSSLDFEHLDDRKKLAIKTFVSAIDEK